MTDKVWFSAGRVCVDPSAGINSPRILGVEVTQGIIVVMNWRHGASENYKFHIHTGLCYEGGSDPRGSLCSANGAILLKYLFTAPNSKQAEKVLKAIGAPGFTARLNHQGGWLFYDKVTKEEVPFVKVWSALEPMCQGIGDQKANP